MTANTAKIVTGSNTLKVSVCVCH